jgi:hypothetical protein
MGSVGMFIASSSARNSSLSSGVTGFGWLGPDRGDVAPWSAVTKMPLKPGFTSPEPDLTRPEVVVRPV